MIAISDSIFLLRSTFALIIPFIKRLYDNPRSLAAALILEIQSSRNFLFRAFERALSVLEEAAKEENLEAGQRWEVHLFTVLARTYRAIGKIELAKEAISRALRIAGSREERGWETWAMLIQAGIHVDEGRLEEATGVAGLSPGVCQPPQERVGETVR